MQEVFDFAENALFCNDLVLRSIVHSTADCLYGRLVRPYFLRYNFRVDQKSISLTFRRNYVA